MHYGSLTLSMPLRSLLNICIDVGLVWVVFHSPEILRAYSTLLMNFNQWQHHMFTPPQTWLSPMMNSKQWQHPMILEPNLLDKGLPTSLDDGHPSIETIEEKDPVPRSQ